MTLDELSKKLIDIALEDGKRLEYIVKAEEGQLVVQVPEGDDIVIWTGI